MQIELIGCTSAGKSSLIKNLLQEDHLDGLNLVTSYDFVLKLAHLDWIKHHPSRMASLNIIALFACLLTWRKNLEFYKFVSRMILQLPPKVRFLEKFRIVRIAARNVGIYELVRRYSSDRQVVMVDEGTLHIANYLFVHVSVEPNMHDLDSFVRLVSLPDVAVYIKQPASVLIERTRTRGHKRIPGVANVLVDRFIKHSLAVFEKLAAHSRLETRLLLVDRGECTEMTRESSPNPLREYARRIITNGIIPTGTENLQTDHA